MNVESLQFNYAQYTINDLSESELERFKEIYNIKENEILIGGIFVYQNINGTYQKKEVLDLYDVLTTIQDIKNGLL